MAIAGRPDHDALYHRLFSHPGVVAQLLRDFAEGPWLTGLDLNGMERLNTKFHAPGGERREGDMVWRIPRLATDGRYQEGYLVLLLEFQSSGERLMALRMLAYAALLWQHLAAEQRLPADGMLPPLLPVVLYNGPSRWRVPLAVRDLVGLPEGSPLWPWQPDLRYHVIDAGAFAERDLAARDGLPALLFRLEGAPDPAEVVAVADALLAWFARHPGFAEARAVFVELLRALMAPLGPDIRVPEELGEVRNMLATRAEQWIQAWRAEGMKAGHQEVLQAGIQEGIREGWRAGEAAMLLRVLERRFGPLPDWARERVGAAEVAALEDWGSRLLDGGSLDDVLGERPT